MQRFVPAVVLLISMAALAQEKSDERREAQRKRVQELQHRDAEERRRRDAQERQNRRDAEALNRQRNAEDRDRQRAAQRERREAEQIRQQQNRLRAEDEKRISAARRGTPAAAPAAPSAPAAPVRSSRVNCSAQPACPTAAGPGNVCRGVQQTYADSAAGMAEITARCRSLNTPDPCGIDVAGDMSAVRGFRLGHGGGCAQQCATVARCNPVSR